MADNSFPTYQTISKPYDALMNRVGGDMNNIESGVSITGQSNLGSTLDVIRGPGSASAPTTQPNAGAGNVVSPADVKQDVISGQAINNTWINSWIKSTNYLPKKVGFFIDGQSGYIECRDFYSNNATIASGTISGTNIQTISPTDNIQAAIDALHVKGGGMLRLTAGTYTVNTNLIGYSNIEFVGDNQNSTYINFNSSASGFIFTGENVYTTGTIIQVAGNNFTGSGTSWNASMTGGYIFINNRWLRIVNVASPTYLITAESADISISPGVDPAITYRISAGIVGVRIREISFINSTLTALKMTDVKDFYIENCTFYNNGTGIDITNCSLTSLKTTVVTNSAGPGVRITNAGLTNMEEVSSASNLGDGVQITNYNTGRVVTCAAANNGGNGYKLTSVVSGSFAVACSGNGENGITLQSNCNNNLFSEGVFVNNGWNGIQLLATSDSNSFSSTIIVTNNGWYGVDIAAASCDTNAFIYALISGNFIDQIHDAGTNTIIIGRTVVSLKGLFGGDGTDGALSITSGTTTIDLGNAQTLTKNYSSISITGTGKLAFSNPNTNGTYVVLKSMGGVTLTSSTAPMLDFSGLGGQGGAGGVSQSGAGNTTYGADGNAGYSALFKTNGGSGANGGSAGALPAFSYQNITSQILSRYSQAFLGAGGGGGGALYFGTGGNGGGGGGCGIVECAGAWNFTTASGISVAGSNGAAGVAAGGNAGAGGGGGGAGGFFLGLYNTLTANSGTISVSGGTVGANGVNGGSNQGKGGGSATNAGSGTTGGAGISNVILNTMYT
jgi:hypothetical protein